MFGFFKNKSLRLVVALISAIVSTAGLASAQSSPRPYLQPIIVQTIPTPVPLVKKTGSVTPVTPDIINPAEMAIPGYSGVLVETLDGKVVKESYSNFAFNPA